MPFDDGRNADSSEDAAFKRTLGRLIEHHRSLGHALALLAAAALAHFVVPTGLDVPPAPVAARAGIDGGTASR